MACQTAHHGAQWQDSSPAHPWVIQASSLPTPTQPWLTEARRLPTPDYPGVTMGRPPQTILGWLRPAIYPPQTILGWLRLGVYPPQTILGWLRPAVYPPRPSSTTVVWSLPTTNHPRVTETSSLPTQTILGWLSLTALPYTFLRMTPSAVKCMYWVHDDGGYMCNHIRDDGNLSIKTIGAYIHSILIDLIIRCKVLYVCFIV